MADPRTDFKKSRLIGGSMLVYTESVIVVAATGSSIVSGGFISPYKLELIAFTCGLLENPIDTGKDSVVNVSIDGTDDTTFTKTLTAGDYTGSVVKDPGQGLVIEVGTRVGFKQVFAAADLAGNTGVALSAFFRILD